MLIQFAEWDWEKGWVQQFHLGALRNNNSRMITNNWDLIPAGILSVIFHRRRGLAKFLDRLDTAIINWPKTILYNLNPADNELMATMIGNFNDGSAAGKIQWGSAWWFLDQKDGMTKQTQYTFQYGIDQPFHRHA